MHVLNDTCRKRYHKTTFRFCACVTVIIFICVGSKMVNSSEQDFGHIKFKL